MENCIFCKIVKGDLSSEKVYESETILGFKDIHPSAPVHFILVPKEHFDDAMNIPDTLWVEFRKAAREIAAKQNTSSFRLATNIGDTAAVKHMHIHFLSGITKERTV